MKVCVVRLVAEFMEPGKFYFQIVDFYFIFWDGLKSRFKHVPQFKAVGLLDFVGSNEGGVEIFVERFGSNTKEFIIVFGC